jgi:hypothetical protein
MGGLTREFSEVLILVDFKSFKINVIQEWRDFLEVLILKGVSGLISPS